MWSRRCTCVYNVFQALISNYICKTHLKQKHILSSNSPFFVEKKKQSQETCLCRIKSSSNKTMINLCKQYLHLNYKTRSKPWVNPWKQSWGLVGGLLSVRLGLISTVSSVWFDEIFINFSEIPRFKKILPCSFKNSKQSSTSQNTNSQGWKDFGIYEDDFNDTEEDHKTVKTVKQWYKVSL